MAAAGRDLVASPLTVQGRMSPSVGNSPKMSPASMCMSARRNSASGESVFPMLVCAVFKSSNCFS